RAEWRAMAAGAVSLTRSLTRNGRLLPPDWAELTAAGALRPEPAPNGSQPQTQYGLDAQRTVAWDPALARRGCAAGPGASTGGPAGMPLPHAALPAFRARFWLRQRSRGEPADSGQPPRQQAAGERADRR